MASLTLSTEWFAVSECDEAPDKVGAVMSEKSGYWSASSAIIHLMRVPEDLAPQTFGDRQVVQGTKPVFVVGDSLVSDYTLVSTRLNCASQWKGEFGATTRTKNLVWNKGVFQGKWNISNLS